jgi:hypothetical protein
VEQQNQADGESLDDPERGTSDAAQHETEDDEFERFEDLTRKLVNVPKSEVDKKREDDS